jgi:DNA polymerase III epsilon subunit-like protein
VQKQNTIFKMQIFLYYDIETTGLGHGTQICSIGAFRNSGCQEYHEYLIPTCSITQGATKIHGMTKVNGMLHLNGRRIEDAVPIYEGLKNFLDFLADIGRDAGVLLVIKKELFNYNMHRITPHITPKHAQARLSTPKHAQAR